MQLFIYGRPRLTHQIWLAMRITFVLLTASFLQVSAAGNSQTVNFSGKGVPLKKVFTAIKNQTGIVFFYDVSLLRESKPVTLELKNVSVETALNEIFKDQSLTWIMENKTITVIKKPVQIIETTAAIISEPIPLIDVRGRIVNEKGEPVAGVTVTVKGSKVGTSTGDKKCYSCFYKCKH